MKTLHMMKNLKIEKILDNYSLRMGYDDAVPNIGLYLIHSSGSVPPQLIREWDVPIASSGEYAERCRQVAADTLLVRSLVDEYAATHDLSNHKREYIPPLKLASASLDAISDDGSCPWQDPSKAHCAALGDDICYLVRGTKKHPQVAAAEDCKVYERVQELI